MKMNKKLRRILLTVCSAALLVCVTVGATVAYLTSTDKVENTFTVGNVQIKLDEADVDVNGVVEKDKDGKELPRVQANEYKLMPGHTYTKDPIVHVDAASEDCWLFVKVENGIANIEASTNNIASQLTANGWKLVSDNVYAYHKELDTNLDPSETSNTPVSANTDVKVFESFMIDQSVIGGNKPETNPIENAKYLGDYTTKKIVITAYAIQADGFTTAEAAWATANSSFN